MPPCSRRSVAPFLALLLAAGVLVACGSDSPTAPGPVVDGLTVTVESASIDFHHAPGDRVDVDLQQAFHDWFTGLVGVEPPGRVQYFKYRNVAHMEALTGEPTFGWADPPFDVHSIFPAHPHEAVHLYTHQVGRPSDFFNEGIAMALGVDPRSPGDTPRWNNVHVHTLTRSWLQGGTLPGLSQIVESGAFRGIPDDEGYPIAGSFVRFLYDRESIAPLMAFFRDGRREESLATIRARFRACFGESLEAAESAWRDFLEGWAG